MKPMLAVFLDTIFLFFACTFLVLVPLAYYHSGPLNIVIALLLASSVCLPAFFIFKNNAKKKYGILGYKKRVSSTLNALALMDDRKLDELFKSAFEKRNLNVKTENRFIINDCIVATFLFKIERISADEIVSLYKNLKKANHKLIIFTNQATEHLCFLSKNFKDLILYNGDKTYAFLEKYQDLPEVDKFQAKPNFSTILHRVFAKKRASKFFVFGLTFFLFGFIVPFKLYYAISGAVMFSFAIVCVFSKNATPSEKDFFD